MKHSNDYIIFTGTNHKGLGKATQLGCPTINIHIDLGGPTIFPGSYVGYASNGPAFREALIYVSPHNGHYTKVEIHIIDGITIVEEEETTVKLLEKIRPTIKFNSVEELVQVIQLDIEKTKEYFSLERNK